MSLELSRRQAASSALAALPSEPRRSSAPGPRVAASSCARSWTLPTGLRRCHSVAGRLALTCFAPFLARPLLVLRALERVSQQQASRRCLILVLPAYYHQAKEQRDTLSPLRGVAVDRDVIFHPLPPSLLASRLFRGTHGPCLCTHSTFPPYRLARRSLTPIPPSHFPPHLHPPDQHCTNCGLLVSYQQHLRHCKC